MATVSNQHYTPITPLPAPKVNYPVLTAVVQRVAFAVLFGVYSAAIGGAMGLMGWIPSPLGGAISGSILGFIGAIAHGIFASVPTAIESYRVNTLRQIKEVTQTPRAIAALDNLVNFFYYPLSRFGRPFDYALLHSELTAVTDSLDRHRPDILQAWAEFLKNLHGTSVKLPSGQLVLLDMSQEYRRLRENRKERIGVSWATSYFSSPSEKVLNEIHTIQQLTLGRDEQYSQAVLRQIFKRNSNVQCVVSRDEATNQVVGYGWYYKTADGIQIGGLGRKPDYSRLGIGSMLLRSMLQQINESEEVTAIVRKSNPAVHLFKVFGFEVQQEISAYYKRDPKEDGVLLKLNWESFHKALNPQQ